MLLVWNCSFLPICSWYHLLLVPKSFQSPAKKIPVLSASRTCLKKLGSLNKYYPGFSLLRSIAMSRLPSLDLVSLCTLSSKLLRRLHFSSIVMKASATFLRTLSLQREKITCNLSPLHRRMTFFLGNHCTSSHSYNYS